MKIIVDDREHDLMNSFTELLKTDNSNAFQIERHTLHVQYNKSQTRLHDNS